MESNKGIYWLSSYPKSGNTWFRIVLSYFLHKRDNDKLHYIKDIDDVLNAPMVFNRQWFAKLLGFNSALLTDDELDEIRPKTYRWLANQCQKNSYIKLHDAYTRLSSGEPLIPSTGALGAVYFVRNPLDVAVSLAHHASCPVDWAIHAMSQKEFSVPFATNKEKQIRQKLLTWSEHVCSWTECNDMPIKVLRYEDMLLEPKKTFGLAFNFLNLSYTEDELEAAIQYGSFNQLRAFEQKFGFREKPANAESFFRRGIIGDWKEKLTQSQIQKVVSDHSSVMKKFGYL